jgi:hypothetical protein
MIRIREANYGSATRIWMLTGLMCIVQCAYLKWPEVLHHQCEVSSKKNARPRGQREGAVVHTF